MTFSFYSLIVGLQLPQFWNVIESLFESDSEDEGEVGPSGEDSEPEASTSSGKRKKKGRGKSSNKGKGKKAAKRFKPSELVANPDIKKGMPNCPVIPEVNARPPDCQFVDRPVSSAQFQVFAVGNQGERNRAGTPFPDLKPYGPFGSICQCCLCLFEARSTTSVYTHLR